MDGGTLCTHLELLMYTVIADTFSASATAAAARACTPWAMDADGEREGEAREALIIAKHELFRECYINGEGQIHHESRHVDARHRHHGSSTHIGLGLG